MPAIMVSSRSTGRPLRCRKAIKSAASTAAASSKGAIRRPRRLVNSQGRRVDPLRASAHQALAFNQWWVGRLDEAAGCSPEGVGTQPIVWLHTLLTRVYLAQLRPREALAEAERDTAPVFRLQDLALAYHALPERQESGRAPAELISTHKATAAFQIAGLGFESSGLGSYPMAMA